MLGCALVERLLGEGGHRRIAVTAGRKRGKAELLLLELYCSPETSYAAEFSRVVDGVACVQASDRR